MIEILIFLMEFGCNFSGEIIETDQIKTPGYQKGNIVYLRTNDDGVKVHEMWHWCQEKKDGLAKTQEESNKREQEARQIELIWRNR